jgi:23S rRNA (guanosine2251-2'-O)-methyltransferase
VVLPERRTASTTGVVFKASAGAAAFTNQVRVTNLVRALDQFRDAGIWSIGLDGGAPSSLYDADLTSPLALVVGGEGEGLRRLTREHCDLLVRVPVLGNVQSLNASVAGAIAMYEVVRQRRGEGKQPIDPRVE